MTNHLRRISFMALAGLIVSTAAADATAPAGRFVVGTDTGAFDEVAFPVVFDKKTKLTWDQRVFTAATAADAAAACTPDLTNTVGWRLPTVRELLTLIDYSNDGSSAAIDATYFPNTPAASFWSSTSSAASPEQCADFRQGFLGCYGDAIYARCVH
jgi:Protein of unknown function (DUF1566)